MDAIVAKNAALIVIDVQNDYCHEEGALGRMGRDTSAAKKMIPNLQMTIKFARENHIPIIFIQTIHEDCTDSDSWKRRIGKGKADLEICRKDTWGSEFYGVEPRTKEPIVIKHRYSAFVNTRLDTILRTLQIDTLIMTGVSTNVCVESTARDGFMRDYHILFLSDCTAAFSLEEHLMALKNIDNFFGVVCSSMDLMKLQNKRSLAIDIDELKKEKAVGMVTK